MAETALRIGTRGSRLALRQAEHVRARLAEACPGTRAEIVVIATTGDRVLDTALSAIGDKGLFTHEIEEALIVGRIDMAVHSLKDLPTRLIEGLTVAAIPSREDPRDVLVSVPTRTLGTLDPGARIGTSSLRRRALLLSVRPDLKVVEVRGNVPTRLDKLHRGACDGLILARAGLRRLGLEGRGSEILDPVSWLPAPGQGALAIEARIGDSKVRGALAPLDHPETRLSVAAERGLLARLEGGCQAPIGALAHWDGRTLRLDALVASLDGRQMVRCAACGEPGSEDEAAAIGLRLADRMVAAGAGSILRELREQCRVLPGLFAVVER